MQKKNLIITFLAILIFFWCLPIITVNANTASVRYQVHLKEMGWINVVKDGKVAGTTGQARRMEAIAIALSGVDGQISYKVHCETYGWMPSVSEGIIAGTTGESKRMEAIIINLNNSSYEIKYRVHVQE